MFTLQRQNAIMEYFREHKAASIHELAVVFNIGEATIRRDLDKLEQQKLLTRTYGGAVLQQSTNAEIPLIVREQEQSAAKELIGKTAASLVADGDVIILDSSTTTNAMIPYLKSKKNLTIVTNGVRSVTLMAELPDAAVYCTGGKLRANSHSLVGQAAREFIENITAQKLFFSCRALSVDGTAMDNSENEAELRKIMLRHAAQSFLLCDTSKLGNSAFYKICGCEAVSGIIMEKQPDNVSEKFAELLIV